MKIIDKLYELEDKEYARFQAKLTPGVELNSVIGVRVPLCRNLAKSLYKADDKETVAAVQEFLQALPHKYYDENMLHGLILSEMKDFDSCVKAVDAFLPFIDNWAVCDIMSPKVFKKNKVLLLKKIKEWSFSSSVYTCRFGVEMLMSYFLDDDFYPELLEIPVEIESDEYYVNMMIAWFFATALAKQWNYVIPYLEKNRLGDWVQNKTIQKARESYRITPAQKEYLKTLKR